MNAFTAALRAHTLTPLLALGAATLAACGGVGNVGGVFAGQVPGECEQLKDLAGPGAGTATAHGTPQRSDGAVTIGTQGGMVTASRLVTVVNDFGGASAAQIDLGTPNGGVIACPRSGGGYGLKLMLQSRAPTEADARRGLDSITVNHTDTLAGTTLRLGTTVQFNSLASGGVGGVGATPDPGNIQRSASMVGGLPPSASYALTATGANGDARASGLSGSSAKLSTTNGSATLDTRWDTASLSTTNGIASVSGDYATLDVTTTNGLAEGSLATVRNLTATFTSSNGSVDVGLNRSEAGVDLKGSTTNGRVRIDAPNTVAVGTQSDTSARRQSSDYASRAVKVQVEGRTSNGNVDLHQ